MSYSSTPDYGVQYVVQPETFNLSKLVGIWLRMDPRGPHSHMEQKDKTS